MITVEELLRRSPAAWILLFLAQAPRHGIRMQESALFQFLALFCRNNKLPAVSDRALCAELLQWFKDESLVQQEGFAFLLSGKGHALLEELAISSSRVRDVNELLARADLLLKPSVS